MVGPYLLHLLQLAGRLRDMTLLFSSSLIFFIFLLFGPYV